MGVATWKNTSVMKMHTHIRRAIWRNPPFPILGIFSSILAPLRKELFSCIKSWMVLEKKPGSLQHGLDWSLQLQPTPRPLMFAHSVVNLQSQCRRTWESVTTLKREPRTVQTSEEFHRWLGLHQTEVKTGTCVQLILSRKHGTLLLHKFFWLHQEFQSRWSDRHVQPPVLSPKYITS